MRKHGGQRGQIGWESVIAGLGQPFTVAAPRHVGAKHPEAIGERRGQRIEVAPVAGQAVHTHDYASALGMTPVAIDDAVETVRAQAAEGPLTWLEHGSVRK